MSDTPAPGDSGRGRLRLSGSADGPAFAYRHDEVIATSGDRTLDLCQRLYPGVTIGVDTMGPFTKLDGIPDPVRCVRQLQTHGVVAQPNHVHFGHQSSQDLTGHELRNSSARPAPPGASTDLIAERLQTPAACDAPHVIVLDTGLADAEFLPRALVGGAIRAATATDTDRPDENGDGVLDPAAGHGTFIAGLIGQIAPGCHVTVHRVLSTVGVGHEWAIARCLTDLAIGAPGRTILSLSFGGYVLDHPHLLAWAIRTVRARGVTVVASAGNDASDRPAFPAAFPNVISVGAIGPAGPAPFTNYGPWVNTCAPGVDLLSTFFQGFNGPAGSGPDGVDGDAFNGWAIWSGTSFSGPVVVGNLARRMMSDCASCDEAVDRVVGVSAMRMPGLGTIVNAM